MPPEPAEDPLLTPTGGDPIRRLLDGLTEIPSLPAIYMEIKREVDNPYSSITQIGEVISRDQSLTARLLKLANSAFFGFPRRIETISEAVSVIGLKQVRDLALCTKVIEMFEGIPDDLFDTTAFWKHSIGCGITARVLASYHREPNVERFFVAGLLHDIGRLVLCLGMPDKMGQALALSHSNGTFLYRAEREVIGFDHADVGAALMELWDLPESLSAAAAYHHRPGMALRFPLESSFVHLADLLAHAMELGSSGVDYVPPLSIEAWKRVNLKPTIFGGAMREIDRQFVDVVKIFLDTSKR
ncbi:HD-like signal output (HDOD) domain, no enzymatic activity [Verrucomicrobium sp. GAS474]|uniref:HDOD domain-containing protein n=1 Tax=Verrucomicrobium sp. GAS474 TaxID=1882831 RepID=UPI00087C0676|nr:HDOD domain-containing protein [Verrucomicrobium sp. GAS474]SDU09402.1 HD-like signal output (HDOD) domain, no enzymatic activity [Verrucomicrobium sp. GAS474]